MIRPGAAVSPQQVRLPSPVLSERIRPSASPIAVRSAQIRPAFEKLKTALDYNSAQIGNVRRMGQITTGVRRILGNPALYDLTQNIFGARRIRREFVDEFVVPQQGDRVLDIGCGTGDLLAFLPAHVEYVGIEPSSVYARSARMRFGARARFICGFFEKEMAVQLGRFDIAVLGGVLHHLDDKQVALLFDLLGKTSLSPDGRVVSHDPVWDEGQSSAAAFFIGRDRGRNVRTAAEYLSLAGSWFASVDGVTRHRAMPPYTHFMMTCRQPLAPR